MNKNSKYIGIVGLLGLGLLAALGSACGTEKVSLAATDSGSTPQGITVSGEGKASGVPDTAVLSLGVSTVKATVKDARDDAASTMQNVVNAIKNDGVDEKDVQTTQYDISPEYSYPQSGTPKLIGYRVTNTVTVKVRDVRQHEQGARRRDGGRRRHRPGTGHNLHHRQPGDAARPGARRGGDRREGPRPAHRRYGGR